jgi:peptidyl-prolyl cis-trans isomerase A (cyclophilin A)
MVASATVAHRDAFTKPSELIPGDGQLRATIETSMGAFTIELLEEIAPNTVSNFVGLATGKGEWTDPRTGQPGEGALYDGVTFHRVIEGFMLQGGDPAGTGRGGPGYKFDDECSSKARHDAGGVLSMANSGSRGGHGTNGSQFFVTHNATPHLDGKHTVFGRVTQGLNVVNAIVAGDTMESVAIEGDTAGLKTQVAKKLNEWNAILDKG